MKHSSALKIWQILIAMLAVISRMEAQMASTNLVSIKLFNTGVNEAGGLLSPDSLEPHYLITESVDPSEPGPNAYVMANIPSQYFEKNGPRSAWIVPYTSISKPCCAVGTYRFRLIFDLSDLNPATAKISGVWASDNQGKAILINGFSIGTGAPAGFDSFTPFNVTNRFIKGTNTLDFILVNENGGGGGWNPVALRVELKGTALPSLVRPEITQQPSNIVTNEGVKVAFTVRATGNPAPAYQWWFSGSPLLGETNPVLVLSNVQTNQDGIYWVVVTNLVGSTNSAVASLTVNVPPVITEQPVSITTNITATVTFSVAATGTAPLSYQWMFNSSPIVGATNSTLTLLDVQTSQDGAYSVTVTNVAGTTKSSRASLLVVGPPIVSIISPKVGSFFSAGSDVLLSASAFETNGTIQTVQFFLNTISLLGSISVPPYELLWSNVLSGTNLQLTAVATDAFGLTSASSVTITVSNAVVSMPLAVSIVSPANNASFCNATNLAITAVVSNAQPVASIQFLVGSNRLESVAGQGGQSSYIFNWSSSSTVPLAIGNYALTAVATDAQGHSTSSPAVAVSILAQCAQVAIIGATSDPEIDVLTSYLADDMNLSSQVFDQAGLNAGWLQGFKLIICDLGQLADGLASNTVDALSTAYSNGIPLYLIGEHLASAADSLPSAQQLEWKNLTFLSASNGTGGSGSVQITNLNGSYNPIVAASFGPVTNFEYPPVLDLVTNTQSGAEVFGVSGGADVLIAYPGPDLVQTNFTGTNLFVQNVRVLVPGAPEWNADLKTLFENTVCWLTGGCTPCPAGPITLTYSNPPPTAQVGQPLTLALTANNNNDCPSTGVVITNVLPPDVQYISATSSLGTNSIVGNQLVFHIGLLTNRQSAQMQITVMPKQTGVLTNIVYGGQNGYGTVPPPQFPPLPQAIPILGLSLQRIAPGQLNISLFGQAGITYEVDRSVDLQNWLFWTNVPGLIWADLLTLQTKFLWQFYRAIPQ